MPLPVLRPYQMAVAQAVMRSALNHEGRTITVEIARQGGKNEVSAQVEVYLLTLAMEAGGTAVKCSPTFLPQAMVSLDRLKARLADAGMADQMRMERGYVIRLGRARQAFYSAEPSANVVGATAGLLLEVDEAQDVDPEKYQKEFRPMASSRNATTVLYGTPWDATTLLEEQKQANLELERRDGIRRHFRFDWQQVAGCNPDYGRFVEAERVRLGEEHPLFRTQYALELLEGGRGFLSTAQRAWLQGRHGRRHGPDPGGIYVAGIDVAGEAESPSPAAAGRPAKAAGPDPDAAVRRRQPRRDSTVVTIARLDFAMVSALTPDPRIEVVEHLWWTGRNHASLIGELAGLLRDTWGCRRAVVDATGVGAGLASMLVRLLGSRVVRPFIFTAPAKSRLGFALLAAVNGSRLKLYGADGSPEFREFWQELDLVQTRYRGNQTMDFFVDPRDGHDDFVMSLALAVEAAAGYEPRVARGTHP